MTVNHVTAHHTTFNNGLNTWNVIYRMSYSAGDTVFDGFANVALQGFSVPLMYLFTPFLSALEDHCVAEYWEKRGE